MTEEEPRIIVVDHEPRGYQLEALARLAAMMDPTMLDMPVRHRELPPPVNFMPYLEAPRRERYRDWEDRKKPRPNLKRARQKAQKQARRRNRR
jgi:hypothetical protein